MPVSTSAVERAGGMTRASVPHSPKRERQESIRGSMSLAHTGPYRVRGSRVCWRFDTMIPKGEHIVSGGFLWLRLQLKSIFDINVQETTERQVYSDLSQQATTPS